MKRSIAVLTALLCCLLWACEAAAPVAGRYEATTMVDGQARTVTLELRDGGEGAWTTEGDAVTCKWDVKGGEVLLHAKAGGVIRVETVPGGLRLDLPGIGRLDFRKVGK